MRGSGPYEVRERELAEWEARRETGKNTVIDTVAIDHLALVNLPSACGYSSNKIIIKLS